MNRYIINCFNEMVKIGDVESTTGIHNDSRKFADFNNQTIYYGSKFSNL